MVVLPGRSVVVLPGRSVVVLPGHSDPVCSATFGPKRVGVGI